MPNDAVQFLSLDEVLEIGDRYTVLRDGESVGHGVVAETMIGVFHVGGRFFALANECPHEGASLAHGIIEGDTVRCRIQDRKSVV